MIVIKPNIAIRVGRLLSTGVHFGIRKQAHVVRQWTPALVRKLDDYSIYSENRYYNTHSMRKPFFQKAKSNFYHYRNDIYSIYLASTPTYESTTYRVVEGFAQKNCTADEIKQLLVQKNLTKEKLVEILEDIALIGNHERTIVFSDNAVFKEFWNQSQNLLNFCNKVELFSVMRSLVSIGADQVPKNFVQILENEAARQIATWNLESCLYVMDIMTLLHNRPITDLKFYKCLKIACVQKLENCSVQNLVQLLFYLSKQVQDKILVQKIEDRLHKCLEENNLSWMECGIIAKAFFKNSYRIKSANIKAQLSECAVKNISDKWSPEPSVVDKFNLINVLKALEYSKTLPFALLMELSNALNKGNALSSMNLMECACFLAAFSEDKQYDIGLFNKFQDHILSMIKKSKPAITIAMMEVTLSPYQTENPRLSDLYRILWSFAVPGHDLSPDFIEAVLHFLRSCRDSKKSIIYASDFINCINSLVILGYYPEDLISEVFTNSCTSSLQNKYFSALFFIHCSTIIEKPSYQGSLMHEGLLKNHALRNVTNLSDKRPGLNTVAKICQQLTGSKCEIQLVLPHIYIPGILLRLNPRIDRLFPGLTTKVSICIEVLDPLVCANRSNKPLGIMDMKIRQLKKVGYQVVLVTSDVIQQLESLGNEEQTTLIKELIHETIAPLISPIGKNDVAQQVP